MKPRNDRKELRIPQTIPKEVVDRFDSLIWFRAVQSQIDKLPDCAMRSLIEKDIQSFLMDGTTYVDKSNLKMIDDLNQSNSQLQLECTNLRDKVKQLTEQVNMPRPVKEIIKIQYHDRLIWVPQFVSDHKGLCLIILIFVCMVLKQVMFPN